MIISLHQVIEGPILVPQNRSTLPFRPMKKDTEKMDSGFTKMLLHEFLNLLRRVEEKQDEVSVKSLEVIVSGIAELAKEVEAANEGKQLRFTGVAFDIFSNLGKSPNDTQLLKRAGTYYLVEWHLPEIAIAHLKRAQALNFSDRTLPLLIEIASRSLKRKNEGVEKNRARTTPTVI